MGNPHTGWEIPWDSKLGTSLLGRHVSVATEDVACVAQDDTSSVETRDASSVATEMSCNAAEDVSSVAAAMEDGLCNKGRVF